MKTTPVWCSAALFAIAGFGIGTSALADDKVVKIGVLTDMSSLYADINGPNTVVAKGVRIGTRCLIGACSLVLDDIPDGAWAFGTPCRVRGDGSKRT